VYPCSIICKIIINKKQQQQQQQQQKHNNSLEVAASDMEALQNVHLINSSLYTIAH